MRQADIFLTFWSNQQDSLKGHFNQTSIAMQIDFFICWGFWDISRRFFTVRHPNTTGVKLNQMDFFFSKLWTTTNKIPFTLNQGGSISFRIGYLKMIVNKAQTYWLGTTRFKFNCVLLDFMLNNAGDKELSSGSPDLLSSTEHFSLLLWFYNHQCYCFGSFSPFS